MSSVVHQDGNFRIDRVTRDAQSKYARWPLRSDWMACHQCAPDKERSMWVPFAFSPEFVSKACLSCGAVAPDGFQAVYWMLAESQIR